MRSPAENGRTQRICARLAGSLLLGVLLLAVGSGVVLSRVAPVGAFAETAERVAASEHIYRAALAGLVVVNLGSALLAFALYVTLKPVNSLLAQLAMIFTLEDSFLGLVVRMCGFARVHLYLGAKALGPTAAQPLADLLRDIAGTTENLGGICFGTGSLLFFYLFFQSRYIPRTLSVLGVFASAIWTSLYFANLVFPEHDSLFRYIYLPPMALAEVLTGFYLILFGVNAEGRSQRPQQASIPVT